MVKIALEAMGGDLGVSEAVKAALWATHEFAIEVVLVGPMDLLVAELSKHPKNEMVSVVGSGAAVSMSTGDVARVVRDNRDASINVATRLVRDGGADAVVSAANTGAVLASASLYLKRLAGVERAAIGMPVFYKDRPVLLIDAGANIDCRPSFLLQFGRMGAAYMEKVSGIKRPRVGILSNGEERSKGNDLLQAAYELLEASPLNFVGYIEGHHIHKDCVDVLVTDGLTGNIALKVGEGVAEYILEGVKEVARSKFLFKIAGLILKKPLNHYFRKMRYEEQGGACLLGVKGVVVIAHGRSNAIALKNALGVANEAVRSGLLEAVQSSFARPDMVAVS